MLSLAMDLILYALGVGVGFALVVAGAWARRAWRRAKALDRLYTWHSPDLDYRAKGR